MEDLKASVTELLVATNIMICQSVYQHLQPVHEDKKTHWQTASSFCSKYKVGNNQHKLYCRAPKVHGV